jgi:aromatic-amino-acid transaminase
MTAMPDLLLQLVQQQPDALIALAAQYREDPRPDKIDLGIGVYRDDTGVAPVMSAVKRAEKYLLESETSKSYLGPEGNRSFLDKLQDLIFEGKALGEFKFAAIQTPGGTGALRLASELLRAAAPGSRVWIGVPTWPNHMPIFTLSGLEICTYEYYDSPSQSVRFDSVVDALQRAAPRDVVLLQGSCHNPTGSDFTHDQWNTVADLIYRRSLIPIVDFAYQGLGVGWREDAAGIRALVDAADVVLIAYSCDKNFGLYRERVGALYVGSRNESANKIVMSNLSHLARLNWSNPPNHGAAIVDTILGSDEFRSDWVSELETMRTRLMSTRKAVSEIAPSFANLRHKNGLFCRLSISERAVEKLRLNHAIYMPKTGRLNIAGLTTKNLPVFARAIEEVFERSA